MFIARRSIIKSLTASVFPFAALRELIGQLPASSPTPALHIVGAGQDRFGEVRGLGFSSLAFKVGTAETVGNMFVIEHRNMIPDNGPGLHLHLNQEEYFYVLEGEVAFQVGEKRVSLKAGESILGPRRVPHCFAAVAPQSRMMIAYAPAGKMEQFFREVQVNPKLVTDPVFNSHCEVQALGPSPFWKE